MDLEGLFASLESLGTSEDFLSIEDERELRYQEGMKSYQAQRELFEQSKSKLQRFSFKYDETQSEVLLEKALELLFRKTINISDRNIQNEIELLKILNGEAQCEIENLKNKLELAERELENEKAKSFQISFSKPFTKPAPLKEKAKMITHPIITEEALASALLSSKAVIESIRKENTDLASYPGGEAVKAKLG